MKQYCVNEYTQHLLAISDSSQAIIQVPHYQSSIFRTHILKERSK